MSSAQRSWLLVGSGIVVAASLLVYALYPKRASRYKVLVEERDAKIASLEKRLSEERARASAADSDLRRLLAAVNDLEKAGGAVQVKGGPSNAAAARDGSSSARNRFAQLEQLLSQGDVEGALAGYAKIAREGWPGFPVASQMALMRLGQLAKTTPSAASALAGLRDEAGRDMAKDSQNRDASQLVGQINHIIGRDDQTIALFDTMPAGDPRRQRLGAIVSDSLLEQKRYADLLEVRPIAGMLHTIDQANRGPASLRERVIDLTAQNVEILVATGHQKEADILMERLKAVDNTESTQAILNRHLARANEKAGPSR